MEKNTQFVGQSLAFLDAVEQAAVGEPRGRGERQLGEALARPQLPQRELVAAEDDPVVRPPPGSFCKASRSRGTAPPKSSMSICERPMTFFAFVLKRPMVLMNSRTRASPTSPRSRAGSAWR